MPKTASILDIIRRLLPALLAVVEAVVEARKRTSPGGRRITHDEAAVIARDALDRLLPEVVEVLVDDGEV